MRTWQRGNIFSRAGIGRQLEHADAMGRELVGLKDPLHRTQAHARRLRQDPDGPVGCFPGGDPTTFCVGCGRRCSPQADGDPLR
jgi:hypothetical protein